MTVKIADQCGRCGKIVVKEWGADSSDMVRIDSAYFLYLCDTKPKEVCRPSLNLSEKYCPGCLLEVVKEWVDKMERRGCGKIPSNHIILPNI